MLLGECAASVAKTFLESDVAVIDIKQPEPVAAGIRNMDFIEFWVYAILKEQLAEVFIYYDNIPSEQQE
ncbi:hypothetical protein LWI29_021132 [Acer saccharum]|uniref:Uncharacterized protein n=1 Tax=Acer saccharum TaxID=4024 RepID=A0AA39STH6_ACESA|nr:hypothetical protein LWI29_021132 [Acer saccharum]